ACAVATSPLDCASEDDVHANVMRKGTSALARRMVNQNSAPRAPATINFNALFGGGSGAQSRWERPFVIRVEGDDLDVHAELFEDRRRDVQEREVLVDRNRELFSKATLAQRERVAERAELRDAARAVGAADDERRAVLLDQTDVLHRP